MNFLLNVIFTLCLTAPTLTCKKAYTNTLPYETKLAVDEYFQRWLSVMREALSERIVNNFATIQSYVGRLDITEKHIIQTEVIRKDRLPSSYSQGLPETYARLEVSLSDLHSGMKFVDGDEFPNKVHYTITIYFFREHRNLVNVGTQHKASVASMETQTNEEAEIQSRLDFHHAEVLHHQNEIKQLESQLEKEKNDILSELECIICRDSRKSVLFSPCNHINTCHGCAQPIQRCPTCRSHINTKTQIFL